MEEHKPTKKGTILYGMKNSGKTTLGKRLAEELDQKFVDTDDLIRDKFGLHPVEIMKNPKLNFRSLQRYAILGHVPDPYGRPEVIATGGSAALDPQVVSHLGEFGVSIFIDVDNEELERRFITDEMDELYNPHELTFNELCNQRRKVYRDVADETLLVSSKDDIDGAAYRLANTRLVLYTMGHPTGE